MTEVKIHQDVIIWNRGVETPQPPWSATLEPLVKGSIMRVAMYFPEHDYGMHRKLEYLDSGLLAEVER